MMIFVGEVPMHEMPPHIIPLNDCLGTLWANACVIPLSCSPVRNFFRILFFNWFCFTKPFPSSPSIGAVSNPVSYRVGTTVFRYL
jgi:hypothetical protein